MKYLMAILCLQMTMEIIAQPINQAVGSSFPYPQIYEGAIAKQQYRAKRLPVILDLFSSSCVVCFKALPKIKELQEKYADQLKFVMVGREDGSIQKVYSRFEKKLGLSFPVAFDSVIGENLQVKSYPVYIWLDTLNIVRGISTSVTEENIDRFLSGRSLIPKKDMTVTGIFNPDSLFLVNENAGSNNSYLFRSILTVWKNQRTNVPPSIYYCRPYDFKASCVSMEDLYRYAFFGYWQFDIDNKLYGKVYPRLLIGPDDSLSNLKESRSRNLCYAVNIADSTGTYERLQQIMQNDLENYFGYEAEVVDRLMPCWYLRAKPEARQLLQTKGGRQEYSGTHAGIRMQNMTITQLIRNIVIGKEGFPVFNETGIDYNIDIELNAIMFDFADIGKGLKVHGLELVEGKKMMKVLVLKPKTNNVAASL